MIKDIIRNKNKRELSILYCFFPIIMTFIIFFSLCKFSLMPFWVSSFIIFFCGRFKNKILKLIVAIFIVVIISLSVLFIYFNSLGFMLFLKAQTEVVEIKYSSDNRYVMVLEETDLGATGGEVNIYVGRNIDFGFLGRYMPARKKYYGHSGERPEFEFVDDDFISINGGIIERRGSYYIDDY